MTDSQKAQKATPSVEDSLTDAQKAAREILGALFVDDSTVDDDFKDGDWPGIGIRSADNKWRTTDKGQVLERIRQIIDRNLC